MFFSYPYLPSIRLYFLDNDIFCTMQITKCAIIKKHSGGAYMIDIHQLEQLIYINDCGTISKAAKQLHISQPALSRSMQRLEEELEVPLFSRTKNKIELNDNGLLAIQLARTIVQSTKDMKTTLKDYDQSKHTFSDRKSVV